MPEFSQLQVLGAGAGCARASSSMPPTSSASPPGNYTRTSLIRNSAPLGPYSRTMPRALWDALGGGLFLMSEVLRYPASECCGRERGVAVAARLQQYASDQMIESSR